MQPSILGLGSEVPPYVFHQKEVGQKMIAELKVPEEKQGAFRRLYEESSIDTRYSVVPDFQKERSEWKFWGHDFPQSVPSMGKRNERFKQEAPELALKAAQKAIDSWGGNVEEITHIISISCTGVMAPGIEFHLMQRLNLRPDTYRLAIQFMGCFGAFKGISAAHAFAKENKEARILIVCTELCSLHFQTELTPDNVLGNALFADGSAAAVIGVPREGDKTLYGVHGHRSMGLKQSLDKMTWEASDTGFMMKLSNFVPALIGRHIEPFMQSLLNEISPSHCDWAIHPGGKSIIQVIERTFNLDLNQTKTSWETLRDFGNMSSATLLFVLERLPRTNRKHVACVGFGPGLSFEGLLLTHEKIV